MALHIQVHTVYLSILRQTYHRAQNVFPISQQQKFFVTKSSTALRLVHLYRSTAGGDVDHRITRTKRNNNRPSLGLICKRLQAKRFSLGAKRRATLEAPPRGSPLARERQGAPSAPPYWLPARRRGIVSRQYFDVFLPVRWHSMSCRLIVILYRYCRVK